MWCNRHRVCFMLELVLHFSSAMNSVSGLLASHTSLGDSPVAHPSFFPLSGETYEQEWLSDWCYWAFGLLLLSSFGLLSLLSFLSLFGLWASIYRLWYFVFRIFGLCQTFYFGCYRYWALEPYAIVLTLYYDGWYYYYFGCVILLFFHFYLFIIHFLKVVWFI